MTEEMNLSRCLDVMKADNSRELYYETLRLCEKPLSQEQVIELLEQSPNRRKTTTPLEVCLGNLIEAGGLYQYAVVEDTEMTIEELIEKIEAEELDKEQATLMVVTTEVGKEVVGKMSVKARLDELFKDKPEYVSAYEGILSFCAQPRYLNEITEKIQSMGIATAPAPGVTPVYPSFLLDTLQKTGVICWNDGWCLTEEGRKAL